MSVDWFERNLFLLRKTEPFGGGEGGGRGEGGGKKNMILRKNMLQLRAVFCFNDLRTRGKKEKKERRGGERKKRKQ